MQTAKTGCLRSTAERTEDSTIHKVSKRQPQKSYWEIVEIQIVFHLSKYLMYELRHNNEVLPFS